MRSRFWWSIGVLAAALSSAGAAPPRRAGKPMVHLSFQALEFDLRGMKAGDTTAGKRGMASYWLTAQRLSRTRARVMAGALESGARDRLALDVDTTLSRDRKSTRIAIPERIINVLGGLREPPLVLAEYDAGRGILAMKVVDIGLTVGFDEIGPGVHLEGPLLEHAPERMPMLTSEEVDYLRAEGRFGSAHDPLRLVEDDTVPTLRAPLFPGDVRSVTTSLLHDRPTLFTHLRAWTEE